MVPRRPEPAVVSTMSAATSSRTIFDTVAGARPVVRAMAACVTASTAAWFRSTSMTRHWLAVRNEVTEPGATPADEE